MKEYLKKIREKTDEEKQRIVRAAAFIATGVIIVVWIILRIVVSSFEDARLSGITNTQPNTSEESSAETSFINMIQSLSSVVVPENNFVIPDIPFTDVLDTHEYDGLIPPEELVPENNNNFFE